MSTNATDQPAENLMVIDTDAGGDDAVAILLALNQRPTWKVVAITTVHGNVDVDQATENTLRILNFVKRTEVPVYKGCHTSIVSEYHRDDYFGHDGMSDYSQKYPLPNDCVPQPEMAVNALIRLVKAHPNQITLVGLGPLTNIALAHRLDRTFSENLKQLFIMGGSMRGIGNVASYAEFNFMCDCEAADIAINEFMCQKTIVTWEACDAHQQPWEWYEKWISKGTEQSEFIAHVLATPVARNKKAPANRQFHCCDLLAMTALVNPSVVLKSEYRHARVELNGQHTRGMMVMEEPSSVHFPNVRLHTVYDKDAIRRTWDSMTD